MPRSKKPPSLLNKCLSRTVAGILESMAGISKRHSKDVAHFVHYLPPTLADKFTYVLLKMASSYPDAHWQSNSLRDLFSPNCTTVNLSGLRISTGVRCQLLDNLDVLKGLVHLNMNVDWESYKMAGYANSSLIKHVKSLPHLRILRLGLVSEKALIRNLAHHCPKLQELSLEWGFWKRPKGCWNTFRSVCVTYRGKCIEDVMFMLDNIPRLHCLKINMSLLSDVFGRCRKSYQLEVMDVTLETRDIFGPMVDSNLLPVTAQCFPRLREIAVANTCDLTPLNSMSNLKTLSICEPPTDKRIVLDHPFMLKLEGLLLYLVGHVQASLFLDHQTRLPNLTTLSMNYCFYVDIRQIGALLPNLSKLRISNCTLLPLTFEQDEGNVHFRYLETLIIDDMGDSVSEAHLEYLLTLSVNLICLDVNQHSLLNDAILSRVINKNRMAHLHTMKLESDGLSIAVVPKLFQFFGEALTRVFIWSEKIGPLPPDVIARVRDTIRPFNMLMMVNGMSFGNLAKEV